ncbi:amino acid adenylation domain-containing protein [Streptomyces laurentii]|uniref:amino acid adenylation domain-containing protein n=1 Tax=Streptomyces laurentii TaxID=39478 RepID=UPI0036C44A4E
MEHENRQDMRWEHTIAELFATQVRSRPRATAVSFAGTDLSYAELDARSDWIAGRLAEHGVGPDAVVAVRVDRGPDLIAALLGVLKAGGAYLALECDMPCARRAELMAAAGAVALVTGEEAAQEGTPAEPDPVAGLGLPVLRLPAAAEAPAPAPPARELSPGGLAYVSFTSGSTGRPKGVAVPHRAVARLVAGGFAATGPEETFLHLSPVAFDASTFEIWACLLTGGRLVLHPPGPLAADELAALLAEEKVTTAWLTAGLFHQMAEHHLEAFAGLRQLLAGGDVLNPAHVNRFVERFPGIPLINGYGPTENTTFTTCHTVREPLRTDSVPIGRPIEGTGIRILDEDLDEVAPGERGQLFATGAGLSRGYLSDPVATALSFLPDPYAETPGARMYRTGDAVRQEAGGELTFLGRTDRQVKIRGHRVDPSEVERALAALPGVRQAVVVVRRDHVNDKSLAAYFVPDPALDQDPEILVAGFRRRLRAALPAPMIPVVFTALDAFPLTANGKVDAAALPVPARTARQADNEYLAPRSATEQLICDLWAEALRTEAVGVLDDFFELGGNSLLAVDLMSRTELVFGVELPIRTLLHNPSVAEFAAAVDELVPALEVAR